MMTGISLDRDNVEMVELLNGLNFLFSSKVFMMSMMLPWIRFVFPNLTGYNRRVNTLKSIQAMLKRIIKAHHETLDENDPRDMIDAFLIEINSQKDPEFSVDQLVMTCLDLMAAGSETTSTTLQWIVEYMVLYPEVQEACYKEIQEKIKESDVRLEDTESLNYCQAVIAEVQRLSAVAVASVQHTTTQQVEVEGYVLPKDCLLLSNLKLFMTNPDLWVEPLQFNPSRFLNKAGEFTKPEYFVPFGHGKRVCMGESLAKSELIVFTVTLIQHLKFESIPGFEPDVNHYTAGFTRIPSAFHVKVSRR
ncbi:cytochrome P450 2U1 [Eurytemora carolleeae]|uniref:cytochrome P450 2U1 n=1 Tax=Eurytemora carolleeae TaxID=1294199 RepID=UPI000C77D6AA|nr:cytochrome P450 2U1 [Eurytemora carolleeae]|eukprot:XP_023334084.1 cytochrome P450 2U1-like [Eurytemora affinis]